jgi:hypothetical protein
MFSPVCLYRQINISGKNIGFKEHKVDLGAIIDEVLVRPVSVAAGVTDSTASNRSLLLFLTSFSGFFCSLP